MMRVALLLSAFTTSAPASAGALAPFRVSPHDLMVRQRPTTAAPLRGRIPKGEPFVVTSWVDGPGCDPPGWARLESDGFSCLARTHETAEPPVLLPRLVSFDHPAPDEYHTYVETGLYSRDAAQTSERLVPYIYGKRWRSWHGPHYDSLEAWIRGDSPVSELADGTKAHFVSAVDTPRGTALTRPGGQIVPADEVFLYTISRFQGRDLVAAPVADGLLPAWTYHYDENPLRAAPSETAPAARDLGYHSALVIDAVPATADGRWWTVPDGLGPGLPGYIDGEETIRRWEPGAPLRGMDPEAIWIDVDVDQQVLALMQGSRPIFVTLVSTGETHTYRTRLGVYRVMDKMIYGDMRSRPGAAEPYHVEKVPWIMHFWPRYALHGVFWHWGFGHRASHGCINLSPRDARTLFDLIHPQLPAGWQTVYETDDDPGTVLRVRAGQAPVPDRRAPAVAAVLP